MLEDDDDYAVFCQLDDFLSELLITEENWDLNLIIPQLEWIKDAMMDERWEEIEA